MRPISTTDAYRPDIDGLRALAIVLVVVFHAFPGALDGGFIGVDVFFVISGFLITRILLNSLESGTFSFRGFYARRIGRIFPALFLVLAACLLFGWWGLLAHEYQQLGKHTLAAAGFVSNFVLMGESGYFDIASDTKPLLHLWSLGIEEQFYVLWPLLLWLGWKRGANLLAWMGAITVLSFGWNIALMRDSHVDAFYSPQTRFWELAVGGLLAWVDVYKQQAFLACKSRVDELLRVVGRGEAAPADGQLSSNMLSFLGGGLLCYGVLGFDRDVAFPGVRAWVPVLGTVFILSAGAQAWPNRALLSQRAVVWVGLISFPLYLWHWPLLVLVRIVEGDAPSPVIRVAAVLLATALAWASYQFVELRVRQLARSKAGKLVLLALIGLMVALGAAGYWVYAASGLPERRALAEVPAPIQRLAEDDPVSHASCLARYGLAEQKIRYCRLSSEGRPHVALVGDSHAAALFSGLSEVLKRQHNEGLLMLGGWLFVDAILYPKGQREEFDSYTGGARATAFVAREPSIDTVVMAARGPIFMNTHHPFYLLGRPEITDKKQVFEIALRSVLDLMLKNGKKVVFVLEVPTLGFDPQVCQDGRPVRITRARRDCRMPRASYDTAHEEYRSLVASVLRDYPAVRLFDPAQYLCDASFCHGKLHGVVLYGDDNHLSHGGSLLLAEELGKVLDGVVGRRAPVAFSSVQ